jgi:hypothetical protein
MESMLLNISFSIIPQDSFRFSSEDAVIIEPGFKYRIYVFLIYANDIFRFLDDKKHPQVVLVYNPFFEENVILQ